MRVRDSPRRRSSFAPLGMSGSTREGETNRNRRSENTLEGQRGGTKQKTKIARWASRSEYLAPCSNSKGMPKVRGGGGRTVRSKLADKGARAQRGPGEGFGVASHLCIVKPVIEGGQGGRCTKRAHIKQGRKDAVVRRQRREFSSRRRRFKRKKRRGDSPTDNFITLSWSGERVWDLNGLRGTYQK